MKENTAYENKKYTYADLEKMDDDKRYEIIDGKLYLMSSPVITHQIIAGEFYGQLRDFLKGKKCTAFIAPLDVTFSESKKSDEIFNVVQPDVFVVCNQVNIDKNKISVAPDFVIEVLSPSNSGHDMLTKMMLYQRYKIREYWIIDPRAETVLPYILNERGVFEISEKLYHLDDEIPVKVLPGCTLSFKNFYQENPGVREDILEEYKYDENE